MSAKQYALYRNQGSNGNTKDWAVTHGPDAEIWWGTTGARLQGKLVGGDSYDREDKKKKEGYWFVGKVWIDEDGMIINRPSPDASQLEAQTSPTTAEKPRLTWRIRTKLNKEAVQIVTNDELGKLRDEWADAYDEPFALENIKAAGLVEVDNIHGIAILQLLGLKLRLDATLAMEMEITLDGQREVTARLKAESELLALIGFEYESVREVGEFLGLLPKPIAFAVDVGVPSYDY